MVFYDNKVNQKKKKKRKKKKTGDNLGMLRLGRVCARLQLRVLRLHCSQLLLRGSQLGRPFGMALAQLLQLDACERQVRPRLRCSGGGGVGGCSGSAQVLVLRVQLRDNLGQLRELLGHPRIAGQRVGHLKMRKMMMMMMMMVMMIDRPNSRAREE